MGIELDDVKKLHEALSLSKFYGKLTPSFEAGNVTTVELRMVLKADGVKDLIKRFTK